MNNQLENIFLVSSVLGFLLSIALLTYIFRPNKANFFLGLIVLFVSTQLLFSWGSQSGYNNITGAFPFWIFLTYYIIPPSIWLFTKCTFDPAFKLNKQHALLFIPAFAEILIHSSFKLSIIPYPVDLMDYQAWIWFIDYIPLLGFILSLGVFWKKYFQISLHRVFKVEKAPWIPHVKLMLLMTVFTLICLLWITFSVIGWESFSVIEFLLVFLILAFSLLIFMDSQPFPLIVNSDRKSSFANYDDQKQLNRLDQIFLEKKLFIRPNLSLKELSQELNLPSRYISYLINRYHNKNFKEFINDYRIAAFITKARSLEVQHKTLLALALESGFNSKSTFNQVFQKHKGQSPSEYLS